MPSRPWSSYRSSPSPGTWIVSASGDPINLGSDDLTLKVWDAATGAKLLTLTGHTRPVYGCAVSPDGTWIVSASEDHSLKVWDAATNTLRLTLTGHGSPVDGCAVSPDGTWIVSASEDHSLKVWDAATGTERLTLTGHTGPVYGCAVSPDGTWIASASWDNTLRVSDAATGSERAMLVLPAHGHAPAWSPVAPVLACGDTGGGVHLAKLVGLGYGPLGVTAVANDDGLTVRCLACLEAFPIGTDLLGADTTCPQPDCETDLAVNPFVLQPPS